MTMLSDYDLWVKCAEWGSRIRDGDPGACMYGFNGKSLFQDRDHALAVLSHLATAVGQTDSDESDLADIRETAEAYLADNR